MLIRDWQKKYDTRIFTSGTSIRQRAPQWLHDGTLKVLAQFTAGKPDLSNAPVATDLAKTIEGRRAIEILSADSVLAWPLVAPPGLSADRVRELRGAFDAMMRDRALLSDAKKTNLTSTSMP